ncbi:MAG: flagellar hook-length control protein FliK, partial [Gemmataceae bacterium]|nr:flagellar hook-length control protein FliK [Gemmataceae bacterium]
PQASPVAPMPATAPARPPAAVQVADGVVAHARTLDRDGTVEFRLRLDPPELGRVYVRLLADGDAVRGHVVVADEAVRQVIESQLPELRQRLEAAGLSVGRFDVSADPGADGRGNPYRDAAAEGGYESAAATARTVSRSTGPARSGRLDVTV